VSDVLLALFHVTLYIYLHFRQLSLRFPYNPVDIYQLETIIREHLRKASLPSYQDTLAQCTTELRMSRNRPSTIDVGPTTFLDAEPDQIRDVFSSILGDVFHFMDRVRVPIHHELKRAYFYFLSEAFLAWDDTVLWTVKDALRGKF
jgi:hypothetical protein